MTVDVKLKAIREVTITIKQTEIRLWWYTSIVAIKFEEKLFSIRTYRPTYLEQICWNWPIYRWQVLNPKRKSYQHHLDNMNAVSIVYPTVCSGADQRKHRSSASLAYVRGIHRWSVNSPHKGPVTGKMLPFDEIIMILFIFTVNTVVTCQNLAHALSGSLSWCCNSMQ